MEEFTLLRHSDIASNAEFIHLEDSTYDFSLDVRYDLTKSDSKVIASTRTNTIMSQKTPGWDTDTDNDI